MAKSFCGVKAAHRQQHAGLPGSKPRMVERRLYQFRKLGVKNRVDDPHDLGRRPGDSPEVVRGAARDDHNRSQPRVEFLQRGIDDPIAQVVALRDSLRERGMNHRNHAGGNASQPPRHEGDQVHVLQARNQHVGTMAAEIAGQRQDAPHHPRRVQVDDTDLRRNIFEARPLRFNGDEVDRATTHRQTVGQVDRESLASAGLEIWHR